VLTFDFETEGIVGNPIFNPPKPVGVSIKFDDLGSRYYAWAHPSENNCSWEDGRAALITALKRDSDWLAHNAPFEDAILREYFGVVKRDYTKFNDSQYLIFLHDPYAFSFSLKPSAERILGLAPDEQTELRDWILRHVPGATMKTWGAFICHAPGNLVGKYAGNSHITGVPGDTDRTKLLFNHLMPRIEEAGMLEAYRREQKLMPILCESTRRGIRLNTEDLERDIGVYSKAQGLCEDYIRRALGDFNIDSDRELAAALEKADQVTEWVLTPTGKRSTSRKNLAGRVKDPGLLQVLAYRGVLATCLGTFAGPWLAQARAEGGRLHPQWNQVRGDKGVDGDISGTRTGRMSCRAPNLQNPPNDFEGLVVPEFVREYLLEASKYFDNDFHDVIHMRQYLLPEVGHVWLKRDFSAQEMRILAHFAEGKLSEAFRRYPRTDPHEAVRKIILEFSGISLTRKYTKITGFGIMYGRGVDSLAAALGTDKDSANNTRNAYYAALPEVRWLSNETRKVGRSGECIVTWGGRRFYREPNPERDLSYKLLNYLIQGSAADQTKESAIAWNEAKGTDDHLLCLVHDEDNISAPAEDHERAMRVLREAMDAERFDVPFCSEGFVGPNWADIEEYKE
jgi:DNA polymerase I-like protein with 3'-5' exonuclease and polymerase domains